MKFSIGPQFSKEISDRDRMIVTNLNDILNNCLAEKKYNSDIEKIYIAVICVSKGFDPFFKARPLKILKDEPSAEFEIKLDFETFFKADFEERINIIHYELLKQSKEILNNKKMKTFDLNNFLNDVEECLNKN